MKQSLVVGLFCRTLLTPFAANALCICLECAWLPKRHYLIQSEHMNPALETGDCVVIDLIQTSPPPIKRGDIVTFDHPVKRGTPYISRVIGLSGDTVQMIDGVVWLNNIPLVQNDKGPVNHDYVRDEISGSFPRCANAPKAGGICTQHSFEETLPNGVAYTILDLGVLRLDNTAKFTVPDNHAFLLSDHRDNSADSRMSAAIGGFGFIAVDDIIGVLNDLP